MQLIPSLDLQKMRAPNLFLQHCHTNRRWFLRFSCFTTILIVWRIAYRYDRANREGPRSSSRKGSSRRRSFVSLHSNSRSINSHPLRLKSVFSTVFHHQHSIPNVDDKFAPHPRFIPKLAFSTTLSLFLSYQLAIVKSTIFPTTLLKIKTSFSTAKTTTIEPLDPWKTHLTAIKTPSNRHDLSMKNTDSRWIFHAHCISHIHDSDIEQFKRRGHDSSIPSLSNYSSLVFLAVDVSRQTIWFVRIVDTRSCHVERF